MDKKIIAIAIVAILVVAAAATAIILMGNGSQEKTVKATGNLPVYGNANNDDAIDKKDVDLMEKLIKDSSIDRSPYPFLDANQDGKLDSADVEIVKKVINKQKCDLYYVNFEDKVTKQSFPVKADRICVNRYFFAEAVDILGLFDKIVLAPKKLTEDRSHMYDMSHIETAYEGGKAPTTELILENKVDLIIADSWDGSVCEPAMEADPKINTFYVDIYSYGNLVKFIEIIGLFVGANERAAAYANFVNDINDYIDEGMKGLTKKKIAITYLGSTITAGNTTMECAPCSSTYLVSKLADAYYSDDKSSRNNRYTVEDEWMLKNYKIEYDAIIAMHEYTDTTKVNGTYYTPAMFYDRCDQLDQKYSAISIKNDGNLHSASFFSITFGSYAHIPMIAHMLFPEKFSEEKGWDYLQEYWSNFSSAKIDVRTQGGWFDTRA